jgi:hypothetical protein
MRDSCIAALANLLNCSEEERSLILRLAIAQKSGDATTDTTARRAPYQPLRWRMRQALLDGPIELRELAGRMDAKPESVERIVRRYRQNFDRERVRRRVFIKLND